MSQLANSLLQAPTLPDTFRSEDLKLLVPDSTQREALLAYLQGRLPNDRSRNTRWTKFLTELVEAYQTPERRAYEEFLGAVKKAAR